MPNRISLTGGTILALALAAGGAWAQTPAGTGFTYQGRLEQAGQPADGTYDFLFRLFDAPDGLSSFGTQQQTVDVADGLFTVLLNANGELGAAAFDGSARWLEIAVRPSGSGEQFEGLWPRQEVTAVPYALKSMAAYALDAADGGPAGAVMVNSVGNVGIGTGSPATRLHLAAALNPTLRLQDTSVGGKTYHLGINSGDDSLRIAETGVADRMVIGANGNVGIGTATPQQKLDVSGRVRVSEGTIQKGDGPITTTDLGLYSLNSGWLRLVSNNSPIQFYTNSTSGTSASGSGMAMTIAANGNVGIGSASPIHSLDVNGRVNVGAGVIQRGGPAITTTSDLGLYSQVNGAWMRFVTNDASFGFFTDGGAGTTPVMALDASGRLGIGTSLPTSLLHMASSVNPTLRLQDTSVGGKTYHLGINSGDDSFRITESGVADRIIIAPGGNVGIGTATPGEKLDVNGTTRTKVLQITGGSDVAEPYDIAPAGETAPRPGMVVAIDPDHVGRMRVAARAYDRTVAGIISGANGIHPGLTLTQQGTVADGAMPVATVGRVWCWVDTDAAGPVEAGDLLTASDTPGHAMKVTDAGRSQGAVIGKAMSSLDSGKGLVLVLVALQ